MSGKRTCSLCPHRVPDVAVEVIVSSQEQATRFRERDRRDAADDVVVRVHGQFLISSDVKQATCGVVRSSGKSIAVGEELQNHNINISQLQIDSSRIYSAYPNSVDIRFVTRERLPTHSVANIPQLQGNNNIRKLFHLTTRKVAKEK